MKYTKKSLIKDLEHKIKQSKELTEGLIWITKQYAKGKLPD